jgi:hypothetical protein
MRDRRLAVDQIPQDARAAAIALTEPENVPAAPEAPAAPVLAEGYYLDNFLRMLDHVVEQYRDLLAPEELAFATLVHRLSTGASRLYVRLLTRKGPLFRRDRLAYAEIPELDAAAAELLEAGLLDRGEDAPLADWLALLLREELAALAAEIGPLTAAGARQKRRPELQELLLAPPSADVVQAAVAARLEVLRPLGQERIALYRLLFFGNLYQDWTEFLLSDLGIVTYERYELRVEHRLFDSRLAIDHAMALRRLRHEVMTLLASGDFPGALDHARAVRAAIEGWHAQSRRHADLILVEVAREAERRAQAEEALALYAAALAPPARERRARLLAGLGHAEQALALCAEIAAEPRDETEVIFAATFSERLRRQPGQKRGRPRPIRYQDLRLPREAGVAVEVQALRALAAGGRPGIYAENWLWKSLFGLAFWDIVFQPQPGVFCHPFQFGPLDLSTPDFRRRRAAAIDERLAELHALSTGASRLLEVYDRKVGVANALVSWHGGSREQIEFALGHLPGSALAAICERLSRDLGRYRRGLPDLFLAGGAGESFELWEVKAPGDQLRPEQIAWLAYLEEQGISAGVLRLIWE